jgi:hypothetical protein
VRFDWSVTTHKRFYNNVDCGSKRDVCAMFTRSVVVWVLVARDEIPTDLSQWIVDFLWSMKWKELTQKETVAVAQAITNV